jgi:TfoX/Sxy family transcriptional regulator of competence genes
VAIDEELLEKLRAHLKGRRGIVEKAIVGGTGFTWRGNLLCGVMGNELLVRIDKTDYDAFIRDKGAHPMVMAGKSGKTYILIPKSIVSRKPEMRKWVDRAMKFVGSLPAKTAKSV